MLDSDFYKTALQQCQILYLKNNTSVVVTVRCNQYNTLEINMRNVKKNHTMSVTKREQLDSDVHMI